MNKPDYWKHFLLKRMSSVLFPAYIVYLLYGLVGFLLEGKWSLDAVIHYILLGRFMQNTNWFVFEILIFYILFWFLYRTIPNKVANILLIAVTALFIGGGIFMGLIIRGMAVHCVFHWEYYMRSMKETGMRYCADTIL